MSSDFFLSSGAWIAPSLVALYDRPPGPEPPCLRLWKYAYGFDGYKHFGSAEALDEFHQERRAGYESSGGWLGSFVELRSLLFWEQRAWRAYEGETWEGDGPQDVMVTCV